MALIPPEIPLPYDWGIPRNITNVARHIPFVERFAYPQHIVSDPNMSEAEMMGALSAYRSSNVPYDILDLAMPMAGIVSKGGLQLGKQLMKGARKLGIRRFWQPNRFNFAEFPKAVREFYTQGGGSHLPMPAQYKLSNWSPSGNGYWTTAEESYQRFMRRVKQDMIDLTPEQFNMKYPPSGTGSPGMQHIRDVSPIELNVTRSPKLLDPDWQPPANSWGVPYE